MYVARNRPPSITILAPVLVRKCIMQPMIARATSSGWTTRLSGLNDFLQHSAVAPCAVVETKKHGAIDSRHRQQRKIGLPGRNQISVQKRMSASSVRKSIRFTQKLPI